VRIRYNQQGSNNALNVSFDPKFNCHVLSGNPKRSFKTGYQPIQSYDELIVRIQNNGPDDICVPLMLTMCPANPTGLCPIICNKNYIPTGIPIQLSKNWHYHELGNYVRFYFFLPVNNIKGWTIYRIRVAYGFYGTLPLASHSNLSLVGYGNFRRGGQWEQLAIGCWGETFCMDIDMDCVPRTITDVRLLLTRNGLNGEKWRWTNAGWGGDWLYIKNEKNERLMPRGWKTAYISHGPCLTEVQYNGYYGANCEVSMKSTVRTLRTDDYARTFTNIEYTFTKKVTTSIAAFFMVGGQPKLETPRVAYGNFEGLIAEHNIPSGIAKDSFFIKSEQLTGSSPWFISYAGQDNHDDNKKGQGWRGIIIRNYNACFSGEKFANPCISFISEQKQRKNMTLHFSPPKDITTFDIGDHISFEVELITIPNDFASYYGPNIFFSDHIRANPCSWKTVHREVIHNGPQLNAKVIRGGFVKHEYPVILYKEGTGIMEFTINFGVGAVPIRFDGLLTPSYSLYHCPPDSPEETKFEPQVNGNDYWQVDFDPWTKHYSLTYNIPFENFPTSRWVLRPI